MAIGAFCCFAQCFAMAIKAPHRIPKDLGLFKQCFQCDLLSILATRGRNRLNRGGFVLE
jgi:hypothetical protein